MNHYLVFYAGLVYGEYEGGDWGGVSITLPDGAYMLFNKKLWYAKRHSSLTPINLCDVPKELRLLTLLLN